MLTPPSVHTDSCLSLDAPGATPHAAWEGHICAIKWRNEEGRAHNGCKGKPFMLIYQRMRLLPQPAQTPSHVYAEPRIIQISTQHSCPYRAHTQMTDTGR